MTYTGMKARDKFVAGDEIEVDGKVYVVVLNANMILAKSDVCEGCAAFSAYETCQSCYFKWRENVQDENADDRQVSLTQERQPADMG